LSNEIESGPKGKTSYISKYVLSLGLNNTKSVIVTELKPKYYVEDSVTR
jgi:hypothetical protein